MSRRFQGRNVQQAASGIRAAALRRAAGVGVGVCAALVLGSWCVFAQAEPSSSVDAPVPAGNSRVIDVLGDIHLSLVASRYDRLTRVDLDAGLYQFDCSGMASWVLRRAAPAAWQGVWLRSRTGRPVARDFVRRIADIQPDRPSWGWERIARVEDTRAGDMIAWLKPKGRGGNLTGHVGFAVAPAQPSAKVTDGFLIRFADSSRYHHQDDTREEADRDGFGVGTLLLIAEPETGEPVAYGWRGEHSERLSQTLIVIGRPRR